MNKESYYNIYHKGMKINRQPMRTTTVNKVLANSFEDNGHEYIYKDSADGKIQIPVKEINIVKCTVL